MSQRKKIELTPKQRPKLSVRTFLTEPTRLRALLFPGAKRTASSPATKKRRIAKASETRRATIAAERARLKAGKPQRTKLKISADPEATRAKAKERHYLKKRGYILDEVTATAFFSEATQRSPRLEAKPRFYSFRPQ